MSCANSRCGSCSDQNCHCPGFYRLVLKGKKRDTLFSAMLLLDLTHTAHTRSLTGIQRVTRALWRELGPDSLPVCCDPYLQAWRPLEEWEIRNLAVQTPATKRSARWPLHAQLRGHLGRLTGRAAGGLDRNSAPSGPGAGLIVPEIFSPAVAAALPMLFAANAGPRVAVFYDAIPLTHPELTPANTVARFPAYLRELLAFDGIAAISRESRDALLGYWDWLGVRSAPPVVAIAHGPSGLGPAGSDRKAFDKTLLAAPGSELRTLPSKPSTRSGPAPMILCVGTIEGRKNHIALLEACERLWARGVAFELRLVGLAQLQTGRKALEKIAALRRAGRPVHYDGPIEDTALEAAYAACAFTVYPSLAEGFGLPVIESLARGKACVCLGRGALGEAAEGGGCLALETVDATALEGAIARLLAEPAAIARLEAEARARNFKSWADYARELTAWMGELSPARRAITST